MQLFWIGVNVKYVAQKNFESTINQFKIIILIFYLTFKFMRWKDVCVVSCWDV